MKAPFIGRGKSCLSGHKHYEFIVICGSPGGNGRS